MNFPQVLVLSLAAAAFLFGVSILELDRRVELLEKARVEVSVSPPIPPVCESPRVKPTPDHGVTIHRLR